MENLRKKQRYQACNNQSIKKLFSVRIKRSNENFFREFISNRNEGNANNRE